MSCCDHPDHEHVHQEVPPRREHIYDIQPLVRNILRQMQLDAWRPDYVVGITRGGLTPAVLISQYLDCPMNTLTVSLRDGSGSESNLWMAEDAYGYIPADERPQDSDVLSDAESKKNILIVDDINDTGATIDWIVNDWQSGCLPQDPRWQDVWGGNVRFAVLVNNLGSDASVPVSYRGRDIDKRQDPAWIVFPWEEWYL